MTTVSGYSKGCKEVGLVSDQDDTVITPHPTLPAYNRAFATIAFVSQNNHFKIQTITSAYRRSRRYRGDILSSCHLIAAQWQTSTYREAFTFSPPFLYPPIYRPLSPRSIQRHFRTTHGSTWYTSRALRHGP